MPTTSSVSSKYPAFTCVTIATTGAESSRRTRTVSPLGRTSRSTDAGSTETGRETIEVMSGKAGAGEKPSHQRYKHRQIPPARPECEERRAGLAQTAHETPRER